MASAFERWPLLATSPFSVTGIGAIGCNEPFDHDRDNALGCGRSCRLALIERSAIGVQLAMHPCRDFHRQPHGLFIAKVCKRDSGHLCSSRMMSRVTMTLTGKPGRMVRLGLMFSSLDTICSPARLMLSCDPRRSARSRLPSLPAPNSAPAPKRVEIIAALNTPAQ